MDKNKIESVRCQIEQFHADLDNLMQLSVHSDPEAIYLAYQGLWQAARDAGGSDPPIPQELALRYAPIGTLYVASGQVLAWLNNLELRPIAIDI